MLSSSSSSTSDDKLNYIYFKPYTVNSSCLDDCHFSDEDNTLELVKKSKNECSYKSNSISSAGGAVKFKNLLSINDFKRDKKNAIVDTRYSSYDKQLIDTLNSAKDKAEVLHVLAHMWFEGRFCDLIFTINGKQYLAHRIVLSLHSQKFR